VAYFHVQFEIPPAGIEEINDHFRSRCSMESRYNYFVLSGGTCKPDEFHDNKAKLFTRGVDGYKMSLYQLYIFNCIP